MNKHLAQKISNSSHSVLHLIFIGTKPDIIKQAPIYRELNNRNELVVVCHTGQHYDYNNSKAVLKEVGMRVDINFKVKGDIDKKLGDIIQQTGLLINELKKYGKIIVPYVHGDTLTACGVALGAIFQKVAPVHIEAGLRTMTPKAKIYKKHIVAFKNGNFVFSNYLNDLKNINNYEMGSFEPFPEQIDTRMIDVVSAIRFAPTKRNYDNIIHERNLKSGVVTVGNTISDAVAISLKKQFIDKGLDTDDYSNCIFFTIHRRETCDDPKRFNIILDILENILDNAHKVILIMHPMFKNGVKAFGEKRFRNISKKYANLLTILQPVPYHTDTIKILNNSMAIITDSGGLQEEASILGKRCIVLRYGTDRVESITGGNNILVPIISGAFANNIINHALENCSAEPTLLYGKNVSKKIVDYVLGHINNRLGLFKTEEQRLDLLCQ